MKQIAKEVEEMYLDYKDNFTSIESFAAHYNITPMFAAALIDQGKKLYES